MKSRITSLVIAALLAVTTVAGAEDGIGVGAILGEPTGISVKKWISQDQAIDAAAAWSFSENDSFQLHADYLIHNFGVLSDVTVGKRLPVYYGIGARIKFENNDNRSGRNNNDTLLGVRVPFGLSYIFAKAPVDVFAEIVPVLDIVPDTKFDINGAIGARFYFR